jgi:hypothetical protein
VFANRKVLATVEMTDVSLEAFYELVASSKVATLSVKDTAENLLARLNGPTELGVDQVQAIAATEVSIANLVALNERYLYNLKLDSIDVKDTSEHIFASQSLLVNNVKIKSISIIA